MWKESIATLLSSGTTNQKLVGSVDEADGGSCDSGDDVEIAVQWEASMKLTVGAAAAVMM